MKRRENNAIGDVCRALATFALVVVAGGCAAGKPQLARHAPLQQTREQRHEEAVAAFEQARDKAQLEAALDRWKQGDVAGCESRLRTLVARRPELVDAHVQLAELAWSFENAVEADKEFRAALALAPDRAEAHHAFGLMLEATGRADEANEHFAQAAQLAPDNEIYQLSAPVGATTPTVAIPAAVSPPPTFHVAQRP